MKPTLPLALLALFPFAPLSAHAKPVQAAARQGSVRVQITYVEMSRADVRALAVMTPPENAFHNELGALESAAHRAHVSYVAVNGPVLTASTGQPASSQDGVNVTALSVRYPRAFLRVGRTQQSVSDSGDTSTQIIAASHLFRTGETRRITGEPLGPSRYRYVFATVTVLR